MPLGPIASERLLAGADTVKEVGDLGGEGIPGRDQQIVLGEPAPGQVLRALAEEAERSAFGDAQAAEVAVDL